MAKADIVYDWSLEQCFTEYIRLRYNGDIEFKDFDEVNMGYKIRFQLQLYLDFLNGDERVISFRHKEMRMRVGRKLYDYSLFLHEMRLRESKMRTILMEAMSGGTNVTKPR